MQQEATGYLEKKKSGFLIGKVGVLPFGDGYGSL